MPDSVDYETFFGLLAHPETWSEKDREGVEFVLSQQRQLVESCHPKDHKRRESLQAIVTQIESALAR